jgi:hypothetical protein
MYATFFGLPDPPIEQIPDLDSEQMQKIKAREVEASQWVGHTSLQTTSKYTHFTDAYKQQVASELPKM